MRRADDPATPVGPAWLPEVGRDVTALGGVTLIVLVTGVVAGFLLLDRKYAATVFTLAATASGFALGAVLKSLFQRPRPSVVPHLMHANYSSFPSGHSMMSAVVYLTLGALLARLVAERRLKFYVLAVALLLTGIVGVSRVYMGVHYPTDVLAGWCVGLVWASLCWLVGRRLQSAGGDRAGGVNGDGTGPSVPWQSRTRTAIVHGSRASAPCQGRPASRRTTAPILGEPHRL